MISQYDKFKSRATQLRQTGKTYGEIRRIIKEPIPKSTLSYWFHYLVLTKQCQEKLNKTALKNIQKARLKALSVNKVKRENYVQNVRNRVSCLLPKIKDKGVAKIALAMLFLGEGGKTAKGSVVFGNSDPVVIKIFLSLLRYCYKINESRFRCTLQCRADQNIGQLEKFWSLITKIPPLQFYKARVDPRTIGKPSKNPNYKGVCRIDYFSGDLYLELKQIIEVISEGL